MGSQIECIIAQNKSRILAMDAKHEKSILDAYYEICITLDNQTLINLLRVGGKIFVEYFCNNWQSWQGAIEPGRAAAIIASNTTAETMATFLAKLPTKKAIFSWRGTAKETIFHHAANPDPEVMSLLISTLHQINLPTIGQLFKSALGFDLLTKLLLTYDEEGRQPLHIATALGFKNTVHAILNSGIRPSHCANDMKKPNEPLSPLAIAAQLGHTEIIKLFKKSGVPTDDRAMLLAAAAGQKEAVSYFIEGLQVSPNTRAVVSEVTALHLAARFGHLDVVILLIKNGADIDLQSASGKTPLDFAIGTGQPEVVKYFLENGAKRQYHHLLGATKLNYEEITVILLNHDTPCNRPHSAATIATPLHNAVQNSNLTLIKSLLAAGARTDVLDENGRKPLDIAMQGQDPQITATLIQLGGTQD